MLSITRDINELSEKSGISIDEFPPFYFKDICLDGTSDLVYFVHEKINVPVLFSRHLFLKTAQFLFHPLQNNQRLDPSQEKIFIEAVLSYIRKNKLSDKISAISSHLLFKSYPDNSTYCPFGSYCLDLSKPLEELWENLHAKHRNVIRNAEKNNCEIRKGEKELKVFYDLYKKTMERSSLHYYPLSYFQKMITGSGGVLCAVVYYNNKPQGALFMVYSHYGAYYLYGASADVIEPTGLNNYLHWEIIKWCKENNIRIYDFVGTRLSDVSGTRLSGIQMFKERFGASLQKGYIWKMNLTFLAFIYDLLLDFKNTVLFKKNKFVDIIDQERKK